MAEELPQFPSSIDCIADPQRAPDMLERRAELPQENRNSSADPLGAFDGYGIVYSPNLTNDACGQPSSAAEKDPSVSDIQEYIV